MNESIFIKKFERNGLISPTGKKITQLDIVNMVVDKKGDEVRNLLDINDHWIPVDHNSIPIKKTSNNMLSSPRSERGKTPRRKDSASKRKERGHS